MEALDAAFFGKIYDPKDEDAGDCEVTAGVFPKEMPIAMAYVPFQKWEKPYDVMTALARATIFPSLDKPFIGEEAVRRAAKCIV